MTVMNSLRTRQKIVLTSGALGLAAQPRSQPRHVPQELRPVARRPVARRRRRPAPASVPEATTAHRIIKVSILAALFSSLGAIVGVILLDSFGAALFFAGGIMISFTFWGSVDGRYGLGWGLGGLVAGWIWGLFLFAALTPIIFR